LRYSAVRCQFGPAGEPEQPVLHYQTQQRRLMPYLAACFAHHHFSMTFYEDFIRLMLGRMTGEDKDVLAALGMEIHGVSSAGKPLASWTAQHAAQECREACGGHGYLAVSRLGKIRDDNDANCTYEGDNNVLLQQTSNWLLSMARKGKFDSPLGTVDWLNGWQDRAGPVTGDFHDVGVILRCLRVLVFRNLLQTSKQVEEFKSNGNDSFYARNNSQFHLARTLSLVFIQSVVVERFRTFSKEHSKEFTILSTLSSLYASWTLEQFAADLLVHEAISPDNLKLVRVHVLSLCKELVPDAVALTDCLAPPDFILNSALGHSSGNVYQQLHQSFLDVPGAFQRPDFWVKYTEKFREKSKL
jgi:acyl-CoA oxidase